jgi:hypothetical protein
MKKSNYNRRDFIKSTSLASLFALSPLTGFSSDYSLSGLESNKDISIVHLLFKTHLDVGFTDFAENVLNKYFNYFLPSALLLAKNSRINDHKNRFIWTTGSWLIYEYLERADSNQRKQMEQAIEAGDVVWHGLPFTYHTELLPSSMLHAGINLSKILDVRFDKKTIASKMTDVPGHTRSLVPVLQKEGIELLHIGVNPASALPNVPALFNWKAPDGSNTMVMYQGDYGGAMILPDKKTAASIVFTGDNHGPQSQKEIVEVYKSLKRQFPNAEIHASDLNQVTHALKKSSEQLPVITSEIGDSWIHGPGSDPIRMAQFRELTRFREILLKSGELENGSTTDVAFATQLSMVAEHTWGLDVKTFLKSWDTYSQDKFEAARNSEPFQKIEKSWQEKRNYIKQAIQTLPPHLSAKANIKLNELKPIIPDLSGLNKLDINQTLETSFFKVKFNASGAIESLVEKESGWNWANKTSNTALFSYQTFDQKDYDRFHDEYFRIRPQWALADFGKPGLESANPVSNTWLPKIVSSNFSEEKMGIRIIHELKVVDDNGRTPDGCPANIALELFFPKEKPEIELNLTWKNKKATRLPEAIWFSFIPELPKDSVWMMDKSGQNVDPTDVVKDGGRKLHGIQKGVWTESKKNKITIESLDAPLVSPGNRTLLNFDNSIPNPNDGMHFCLCNNVWGTNFAMWMDDDIKFRFKMIFG